MMIKWASLCNGLNIAENTHRGLLLGKPSRQEVDYCEGYGT